MQKFSAFPLHKPFEKQKPDTPLSEIGLRLVADFYSDSPIVLGTATLICGHLVLTTTHVFNDIVSRQKQESSLDVDATISAVQVLPGPEYFIWDVVGGIAHPFADLALLQLNANSGRSHPDKKVSWRCPRINPFAPEIGESIAAFGYKSSKILASRNDTGGHHIDLNDDAIVSVGAVREIFAERRDRRLPFPCYQVSAHFAAGMSGGPVFDESGSLCGLVCSSFDGLDADGEEPVSYVAMLWPLFSLTVNFDREGIFPKGISYPAIELARGGQIHVSDLPRLEQRIRQGFQLQASR